MMREQAKNGLQMALDAAVTEGDSAKARKIADDLAKLEVSTAPKAPPFTGKDVYAVLDTKAPWYGVDPKKSARAEELGKSMRLSKFPTAEAFADALLAAVEAEFKPPVAEPKGDEDPEDEPEEKKPEPKARKTDAPGEGDAIGGTRRASSGPWVKLTDAPADVQKEVKRAADKFAPKTKEDRESFVTKALEAHYAQHQRNKGKK